MVEIACGVHFGACFAEVEPIVLFFGRSKFHLEVEIKFANDTE